MANKKGKTQGQGGGVGGANNVTSTAAQDMLAAALQASNANIAWSTAVATSGLLAGFRTDCSGFASWLLSKGGVNVGDATTVTMPSSLQRGIGSQVTYWINSNGADIGGDGHVIENILGHWFESGGEASPSKIRQMTTSEVMAELGVSSMTQLNSGVSPRQFVAYTPPLGGNKVGGSPVTSGAGAGTNLATVKAAAQGAGIPFTILWGVYGAESAFGTAYTNDPGAQTFGYFGLTSAGLWTPGMSFQQDAQTAAQLLAKLYKENGDNWNSALLAYSGNSYGLAHVQQLAGSQAGATAGGATTPGGGNGITRPGGQPTGQQEDTISPLFDAYSAEIDQTGYVPTQEVAQGQTQFTSWLGDLGSDLEHEGDDIWKIGPGYLLKHGPEAIPGAASSLFDNVAGGINSTEDFIKWVAWIFHPRNILRVVEGLIGLGVMGAGAHIAISNAGPSSSSSSGGSSGRSKGSGATTPRAPARSRSGAGSGGSRRTIVRTVSTSVAARTPVGRVAKAASKAKAKDRGKRQAYKDLVGREAKQAEARGRSSVINRDLTRRQRSLAKSRARGKDVRRKPSTGARK